MVVSSIDEKIAFHWILKNPQYFSLVEPRYFESEDLQTVYKYCKEFYVTYSTIPTETQILELSRLKNDSSILPLTLNIILEYDIGSYDTEWLSEEFEVWISAKLIYLNSVDWLKYIKSTKIHKGNYKDIVLLGKKLFSDGLQVDLSFSDAIDFFDAASHIEEENESFSTGYDWLDLTMGGGYRKGNLYAFGAEPKAGKSTLLGNLALRLVEMGRNVLFITLELGVYDLMRRIGSNAFNIPIDKYPTDEMEIIQNIKRLKQGRNGFIPYGQFKVKRFSASTLTVPDLEAFVLKSSEINGLSYDAVVIDYINLMIDWRNPKSDDTYLKIKHLAEDVRAMGTKTKTVIITATQYNATGYGSNDPSFSHIAESKGLIHTCDALYGIVPNADLSDPNFDQFEDRTMIIKAMALRHAAGQGSRCSFVHSPRYMRIV